MNLDAVELLLKRHLTKRVGRAVAVRIGAEVTPPLGGMRPVVFVQASRFEDLGGVTIDGAQVARRPISPSSKSEGIAEERPARVVIEVSCVAATHAGVNELCAELTPEVLRRLEIEHTLQVGAPDDPRVALSFLDFSASLHRAEFAPRERDGHSYHGARLEFHLSGFLHVKIAKTGRLEPAARKRPKAATVKKAARKAGGKAARRR